MSLRMRISIMDIGFEDRDREKAAICGNLGRNILAAGKQIGCMVKESLYLLTETRARLNLIMIFEFIKIN